MGWEGGAARRPPLPNGDAEGTEGGGREMGGRKGDSVLAKGAGGW